MDFENLFTGSVALLMVGLSAEGLTMAAIRLDPPAIRRLIAIRERLLRLVVEGQVAMENPHFEALYRNVNLLLASSAGSTAGGRVQNRAMNAKPEPAAMPKEPPPAVLSPVVDELTDILEQLVRRDLGYWLWMESRDLMLRRAQKRHARQFLEAMSPASARI